MSDTATRILNVLDRIAHSSTDGHDLDQSVAGFRRLLHGELPSDILVRPKSRHRSYDAFQHEIGDLKAKLTETQRSSDRAQARANCAEAKLDEAKAEIERLKAELAAQRAAKTAPAHAVPCDTEGRVDDTDTDEWGARLDEYLATETGWRIQSYALLDWLEVPLTPENYRRLTPIMLARGWRASTNVPDRNRRVRGFTRKRS